MSDRLTTATLSWKRSERKSALSASIGDVLFWSELEHIDRSLPKISFRVSRSLAQHSVWELSVWTSSFTERAAVWTFETQGAAKEAAQLLTEAVCVWWAEYDQERPTSSTPFVLKTHIRECQSPCEIWAGFPTVRGAHDVERLRRIGVVRTLDAATV